MKHLIITASALLVGSIAAAQSQQPIVAPVAQTISTASAAQGGNSSKVDQSGIGSDAVVAQQGTANGSFIAQAGTDNGNRNVADVLQHGNVQPSISGHLNYSDIAQVGAGNEFMVTQQGDLNQMFGTQDGVDNAALVQQGADGPQQAEGNLALVDQSGLGNDAEVQQRWDNNQSSILQSNDAVAGVGNKSFQSQKANPNQSAGHRAIGEQYGDGNQLVQIQEGPGSGNYAQSNQGNATTAATTAFAQQVQSGEGNEAYNTQFGVNDESFQEQVGSDNLAEVKQNTLPTIGADNYAAQFQDGSDNEARADQNGFNQDAFQEQYGTNNVSTIKQRAGQVAGNLALSIQRGDANISAITQNLDGNSAMVDQLGDGHHSVVNQNASQNASARPNAGFNTATVTQRNANVSLTRATQRAAAVKRHFNN
ncbi:hypothetical protein [Nonlabens ponticola]|uniref:Curlin n=1 Tax=Nonlabens ponticola TaxID=2496866 RepID=A0A3S9MYF1_9FLAO|nr:hypothetical protein [Nonlabens ponticola]AZQ44073.1 hypothetical protein EJ995_07455 [Nonlabens ponticola]